MTQSFSRDDRVEPPLRADELTMLRAFLDYHRDTFRWKCAGLTQEQLAQPLPPSDMTLGGMMKHLAIVDSSWFEYDYAGGDFMPPSMRSTGMPTPTGSGAPPGTTVPRSCAGSSTRAYAVPTQSSTRPWPAATDSTASR